MKKWNEIGRVWEEDHGLLDEEQVAQCERADVAAGSPGFSGNRDTGGSSPKDLNL